jgi:hypothetical protein
MKRTDKTGSAYYAVYEVFYDEKGKVEGWTAEPVSPGGETIEEVQQNLRWMMKAAKQPVLVYDEMEAACEKKRSKKNSKRKQARNMTVSELASLEMKELAKYERKASQNLDVEEVDFLGRINEARAEKEQREFQENEMRRRNEDVEKIRRLHQ